MTDREFLKTFAAAILTLTLSALLLSLIFVALLPKIDPRFKDVDQTGEALPLTVAGSKFRPKISGGSLYQNTEIVVYALRNGEAVLEAPVEADAEGYYFGRLETEGLGPGLRIFLFWHTLERPDGVFYAEIPVSLGDVNWINLRQNDNWGGTLSKIEIGIFGDLREQGFTLKSLSLQPYGILSVLKTTISEWMSSFTWGHASINFYDNTPSGALFPTTVAAGALALLIFPIAWLLHIAVGYLRDHARAFDRRQQLWRVWVTCAVLVWLLLWGEWLSHMALQNKNTIRLFWGKTLHEKKASDWDADIYNFSNAIKAEILGPEGERSESHPAGRILIIAGEGGRNKDKARRLRYHLLPELLGDPVTSSNAQDLDKYMAITEHVILFPITYEEQAGYLKWLEKKLNDQGRSLSVAFRRPDGAMLRTGPI